LLYALGREGLISFRLPAEVVFLAEWGPTLAAVFITWRTNGRAGLRELGRRIVHFRVNVVWYLVALLLTPAIFAAAISLATLFGAPLPDWSALAGWAPRFAERIKNFTPSLGPLAALGAFADRGFGSAALVSAALAITSGGLSEEIGWRGYALPELQETGASALRASVLVGIMWALWHLGPWHLFFTTDVKTAALANLDHVVQYLLLCVPLAVLYTWIYNNTESVLLCILFHAAYNTTQATMFGIWRGDADLWFKAALALTAVIAVVRFGPSRLVCRPRPDGR
jgi:membrane protease YdiL (CAAX protease family)